MQPGAGDGSVQEGAPQPWDIGEVLQSAWDVVKVHWAPLIFGPLLGGVLSNAPSQVLGGVARGAGDRDTILVMSVVGGLIAYVVQTFFTAGAMKMALTAARRGEPQFAQVFSGGSAFLRLLGTNFLVMLAVLLGMLCLIVPGIILGLGFSMAPYYAVDAGMGPIEAMGASWNATKGHKGSLFLFGIVGFLLAILGLIACCVGMFVVQAVLYVAWAIIFARISGRMGAGGDASTFAWGAGFSPGGQGGGPTPPPGGGWGAA